MSAFLDALRLNLICPQCGAMNRPTVYVIDLNANGDASCNCCGHGWLDDAAARGSAVTVRSQA